MSESPRIARPWATLSGYALALVLCAGGSFVALPLLLLPASRKRERLGRGLVYALSAMHTKFLKWAGVVASNLEGIAQIRDQPGIIIAANHPTLLDAIMLFSELPQTFCLVKSDIMRNPILAPLARAAGFVSNAQAGKIVEECVGRLRRGETLVIFPEGTRTVAEPINPFQPGFALLARRAGAPIQTVLIHSKREFLAKNVPFLNVRIETPVWYGFEIGGRFDPANFRKARDLNLEVESYFRKALDD